VSDDGAFEAFYNATYQRLWAYIHRLTGDRARTDDVVQDAYIRLHRSGKLDAAYLYKIATNVARTAWRRSQHERSWLVETPPLEPSVSVDEAGRYDIRRALQRLAPRQRALLWLAYAEGHDHRTIARMTDVAEGSVRVLLFRARRRLLELFEVDR
jgi:RNA polymerase sigma-70 factor (ECF subfamily)